MFFGKVYTFEYINIKHMITARLRDPPSSDFGGLTLRRAAFASKKLRSFYNTVKSVWRKPAVAQRAKAGAGYGNRTRV